MNYQDKGDYNGKTTDTHTGNAAPALLEIIIATLATIAAIVL